MSSKITEDDFDFDRGDEDIVFIKTPFDTLEVAEGADDAREAVKRELEKNGLEIENGQIIAVLNNQVSVLMEKDARILLDGDEFFSRE